MMRISVKGRKLWVDRMVRMLMYLSNSNPTAYLP